MILTDQQKQDIVDLVVGRASRGYPPETPGQLIADFNKLLRASSVATIECVLTELQKQQPKPS